MSARREEITRLATQATQRDGLRSVSFRHLADEIGIKSSSVHYHFPTKTHLAEALVTEYTEHFAERLQVIEHSETSLLNQLDALVDVFDSVIKEQNLCLCGMMAAELTALDEGTQQKLRKFFALIEDWVVRAFERYPHQLRLNLPHKQLAQVFVSGLEGAMLLDRVETDSQRLDAFRALSRALIEQ